MSENLLPFATAVVIHKDGARILLHKREDFRIWSLPGGGLDDGETAEGAAIRETFEETGYQIAVDRFLGSYRHVQFGDLRQVYCGHVIGGGALEKGPETVEVGWFHPTMLPSRMISSTYTVIEDTLVNHSEPIDRDQYFQRWEVFAIKTLKKLRDLRNKIGSRPNS